MEFSQLNRRSKKRKRSIPTLVSQILSGTIKQQGLERDYFQYKVFSLWNEVVGPAIAKHAQPTRFSKGVLSVRVEHSTWMQELQFMKQEIMDRMNREMLELFGEEKGQLPIYFSTIKVIRFQIGTMKPISSPRKPNRHLEKVEPTPIISNMTPEIEMESREIRDKDLREVLRRVLSKGSS